MSAIPGVNIPEPIVPFDTQDVYPTHIAEYGKGGLTHAPTVALMYAIPVERRRSLMLCIVDADGQTYQLQPNLLTWTPYAGTVPVTFFYTQNLPSTVWTVNHPLGGYPSVVARDSGGTEVEGEIQYPSTTQVVLLFSAAISGSVQLN